MANQQDLDYVAQKIIEVLREKFPNDEGYVQSKIYRLAEMDNKYQTFAWALDQLDHGNKKRLFEKLGLDPEDEIHYRHLFLQL
ncbi:hypothetical protein RGN74_000767 [Acinetobacter baumannii]|nr:hypothetical protein [Acinetobacter baumannii]EKV1946997.1 hypothetical protein [Acinetobacter baumannii]EKW1032723.1 hypothetical protein [Acinetobacter baumannii]EKW4125626.1 hypothetical protein [Acinetobacter baumannii]EKW8084691.1 hypothetical protein [Acinetobacter baumannii]